MASNSAKFLEQVGPLMEHMGPVMENMGNLLSTKDKGQDQDRGIAILSDNNLSSGDCYV